jgi:hypothetical protein
MGDFGQEPLLEHQRYAATPNVTAAPLSVSVAAFDVVSPASAACQARYVIQGVAVHQNDVRECTRHNLAQLSLRPGHQGEQSCFMLHVGRQRDTAHMYLHVLCEAFRIFLFRSACAAGQACV